MIKHGIVLGQIISNKEIEVDKAKIHLIANISPPKLAEDIRSFLGILVFIDNSLRTLAILLDS